MPKITRAAVLTAGQIKHLFRVTEATSHHPERDAVILLLGFCCGLRISEVSQITIADIMFPSGKLRNEVSVRAVIAKGCRQRTIYFASPKLLAALERYLAFRIAKRQGMTLDATEYRGLRPKLPVILKRNGYPYELNTKRRTLDSGERRDYLAADSLQSYVTKLYKQAGIKGGSSHSGRRSFGTKIHAKTGDMELVAQLLGHASIDCSMRYVDTDKRILRQAFIDVL
ncbi:site-specific integrase [Deefgea sp. CFH1-16]|uniref:tyrosine-type recombinase/integrase n=1 Tax=Deefgea sp. CFH1-16 TaxID=2675457 RepID=UPI0015F42B98|nr:site-specific integrase [Deefgea sp. CFH1-16]MBM5575791.1 tyrosine-type recombinase/integrase [Deefgea sp. CFH1-16]